MHKTLSQFTRHKTLPRNFISTASTENSNLKFHTRSPLRITREPTLTSSSTTFKEKGKQRGEKSTADERRNKREE